jgi:hypothetical protein
MRIRLRTTLAGPALTAGAGDIVTVAPALAAALIEAGFAAPESGEPEQAVVPPHGKTPPCSGRIGRL